VWSEAGEVNRVHFLHGVVEGTLVCGVELSGDYLDYLVQLGVEPLVNHGSLIERHRFTDSLGPRGGGPAEHACRLGRVDGSTPDGRVEVGGPGILVHLDMKGLVQFER